jgi:FkbM family methyltransferase
MTNKIVIYLADLAIISLNMKKYLNFRDWILVIKDLLIKKRMKKLYKVFVKKYNQKIYLRRGGSDAIALHYVIHREYHLPKFKINNKNPNILDLGTNIGLTLIDFKKKYPNSNIIGVEMDKKNYELALKNTLNLENIKIINKAISSKSDLELYYDPSELEDSYHLTKNKNLKNKIIIKTISINDIIKKEKIKEIDFIKMDIEGEEGNLFDDKNLDWLKITKQIQIELHPQFNKKANFIYIKEILSKKGFKVYKNKNHFNSIDAIRIK